MQAAENLSYASAQKLNLEKACQAVNIRNETGVGHTLKNSSGGTVAFFEDSGQLKLKKTLVEQAQSPIDTSNGGMVVKNAQGTVVAFLDTSTGNSGGTLKILGTKTENTIPAESSDNIFVVRYEGVPVAVIDKDGNLKLWREVEENVTQF